MKKLPLFVFIVVPLLLCSCATAPSSQLERDALDGDARATVQSMVAHDPSLKSAVADANAYAVFPSVGKGAFVVGGGFGQGVVIQNDKTIGYASISSGSVGGSIGGRSFCELILFQTADALAHFKHDTAAFGVEATAVALNEGSSAQINYHDGVAVIVQQRGGLMADASVSGQSFKFEPVEATAPALEKDARVDPSERD